MGATKYEINNTALLESWDLIDNLVGGKYTHSATIEIASGLYGHFSMAVFEQRHSLRSRGLVVDFDEQEDGSEDGFSVERKGVVIKFLRKKLKAMSKKELDALKRQILVQHQARQRLNDPKALEGVSDERRAELIEYLDAGLPGRKALYETEVLRWAEKESKRMLRMIELEKK